MSEPTKVISPKVISFDEYIDVLTNLGDVNTREFKKALKNEIILKYVENPTEEDVLKFIFMDENYLQLKEFATSIILDTYDKHTKEEIEQLLDSVIASIEQFVMKYTSETVFNELYAKSIEIENQFEADANSYWNLEWQLIWGLSGMLGSLCTLESIGLMHLSKFDLEKFEIEGNLSEKLSLEDLTKLSIIRTILDIAYSATHNKATGIYASPFIHPVYYLWLNKLNESEHATEEKTEDEPKSEATEEPNEEPAVETEDEPVEEVIEESKDEDIVEEETND